LPSRQGPASIPLPGAGNDDPAPAAAFLPRPARPRSARCRSKSAFFVPRPRRFPIKPPGAQPLRLRKRRIAAAALFVPAIGSGAPQVPESKPRGAPPSAGSRLPYSRPRSGASRPASQRPRPSAHPTRALVYASSPQVACPRHRHPPTDRTGSRRSSRGSPSPVPRPDTVAAPAGTPRRTPFLISALPSRRSSPAVAKISDGGRSMGPPPASPFETAKKVGSAWIAPAPRPAASFYCRRRSAR